MRRFFRHLLIFLVLTMAHYLSTPSLFIRCYSGPDWPLYVYLFPTALDDMLGLGIVPTSEESFLSTPWAVEVNSLLWGTIVYGIWLLGHGLYSRYRSRESNPSLLVAPHQNNDVIRRAG